MIIILLIIHVFVVVFFLLVLLLDSCVLNVGMIIKILHILQYSK